MIKLFFSTLYIARLPIEDSFSLIKSTCDIASEVQDSIGETPKAALKVMVDNKTALGASLSKSVKSEFTEQIRVLNTERNIRIKEIKRTIVTAMIGHDVTKKATAESFKNFLNPFWNVNDEAMNTQTGTLFEMFLKYNESPSLKQQAQTLGIDVFINELQTVNSSFDTLYKTRNNERATKGPSGSDNKPDAVSSYVDFCSTIEQAVNYSPNDILLNLFNNMDELRKKYVRLVHSPKDTTTPTTTPTTTTTTTTTNDVTPPIPSNGTK
jgi:hypothetical protein